FADREIGDNPIKGGAIDGLLEHVVDAREVGTVLHDVPLGGIHLCFVLGDSGLGLRQRSVGDQPRILAAVVFGLGDERGLVKRLGAVPIQLVAFGIGLGTVEISQCGLVGGIGCHGVGLCCFQRGARSIDVR